MLRWPHDDQARVRGGRLIVQRTTTLPEGTELELLPLDPGDWLDDADRAALHAALAQSQADVDAGRLLMPPTFSNGCGRVEATPRPVY